MTPQPLAPFTRPDDQQTMVYTVDLGDGRQIDVEGPPNATPEQLHAVVSAQQQPQGARQVGPEMQGGFADQLPPQAASHMSPQDEAAYRNVAASGSADDIAHFLQSRGFASDPRALGIFVQNRDKANAMGGRVNYDPVYQLPKLQSSGAGDALARGAIDTLTMGTAPKLGAAVAGIGSALQGNGFTDAYNRMLDNNNAVVGADEQQHPWMRVAGQLLGGFALPSNIEGAALRAEQAALTSGRSIAEARALGRLAARNQMMLEGGAFGAAHGGGSSDSIPDALTGSLVEGALGAATGGLLGQGGKWLRGEEKIASAVDDGKEAAQAALRTSPATADDAARIAAQYGIPSTPATVGGAGAHAIQMGFGNLPGGMSAVAKGVGAENDAVAAAARDIASNLGTVGTRDSAGEAAVSGAQAYQGASSKEGSALYDARDALMGGRDAPVTFDSSQAQLADIARKYPNSDTLKRLMDHPVIRKIAGIIDDGAQPDGIPNELTLGEATDALSHIRGVARKLSQNGVDSDAITSRVNDVKNALTQDVMRAAQAADIAAGRVPGAEGSAVAAQKQADAFWADRKRALEGTLKVAIKSGEKPTEVPAERVYGQIEDDARRQGGNLARLRDTWFRLPQEARNTIAATKIDDMGRRLAGQQDNTGTSWSYDTFLTNFDKMSPQARNIMFGARASEQLQDIAAYSSRLRDLGRSRNFSNTAKNWISAGILGTVGTSLLHGAPMEALTVGASIPASYAAANLFLKTAAMRQWTQRALRVAMIRDPERASSAGRKLVGSLSAIARAEPAIANEVLQLQQRLVDHFGNAPIRAAASPNEVLQTQGDAGNQQPQDDRQQP